MALFLDLSPGDRFRIADTTVTVEAKNGQRTRVRIEGPDRVYQDPMRPIGRAPRPTESVRAGVRTPAVPGA